MRARWGKFWHVYVGMQIFEPHAVLFFYCRPGKTFWQTVRTEALRMLVSPRSSRWRWECTFWSGSWQRLASRPLIEWRRLKH